MWFKGVTDGYDVVSDYIQDNCKFYDPYIVVRLGLRYSFDDPKNIRYTTEFIHRDGQPCDDDVTYYHISDWWEGEDEVEILWAAPLDAFEESPDDYITHNKKGCYHINATEEWYDMPRECSICGCRWMTERDHQDHYCPNCGAEVSIYDDGKCLSD